MLPQFGSSVSTSNTHLVENPLSFERHGWATTLSLRSLYPEPGIVAYEVSIELWCGRNAISKTTFRRVPCTSGQASLVFGWQNIERYGHGGFRS